MIIPTPSKGRLFAALIVLATTLPQLSAFSAWINEIHYDNASGDTNEGIEIAGISGTDLSLYSLALYNGSNGTVYDSITLSGLLPNQSSGFGALWFSKAGIQNGPDGIFLSGPSGSFFLSYEGSFFATNGAAIGLKSIEIGFFETSSTTSTESLQLTGAGSMYSDFNWSAPSAISHAEINAGQSFPSKAVPDIGTSANLLLLGLGSLLVFKRKRNIVR
jgi:hypothetical protein